LLIKIKYNISKVYIKYYLEKYLKNKW
jgi:hypothetical protein